MKLARQRLWNFYYPTWEDGEERRAEGGEQIQMCSAESACVCPSGHAAEISTRADLDPGAKIQR